MPDLAHTDLRAAAATWNKPHETIEETNNRIHDNAPDLVARADTFAHTVLKLFGFNVRTGAAILEIGSGTGYIMEAVERNLMRDGQQAGSIDGLDIAEHMLAKARTRLGERPPFGFIHYDGLTVPRPDAHYDLIYSVAALQHVPKPYVYHLFFEMRRLLKPGAYAVFSMLSWQSMRAHEPIIPWRREVAAQVLHTDTHWHHYYSVDELEAVLWATGFTHVDVRVPGLIWICAGDRPPALPTDFDPAGYLAFNPDVAAGGMDAGDHWLRYGYREGRRWR